MTEKAKLGEAGFPAQIIADASFNPADLDSALITQASLFAYYAEQSYLANKREGASKIKLDAEIAKIDKGIRDAAADEGRKLTESMIDKEIDRSPEVVKQKLVLNEAKATAQLVRDALEALKQRRDMLIQIGVARREEMKGSPRVVETPIADTIAEARRLRENAKAA